MRLFLIVIWLLTPALALAQDVLTQDRWLRHLKEDLLPFWDTPAALGDPVGMFPSMRCDDGAVFNPRAACPEIGDVRWMTPDQTFLIAISRQSFAYLATFHMTGDTRYLALGKAGIDILMGPARNPDGGHFEGFDQKRGVWWHNPNRFTIQKQAYGLLAPAFYYYLTRDQDVLAMIEDTRQTMIDRYRDPATGAYFFKELGVAKNNDPTTFTTYLDQINTFYMLMARTLPEPKRDDWIAEMDRIADQMMTTFYAPRFKTFFLDGGKLANPDAEPPADYGHSAKAHWFLMMHGDVTGDDAEVAARRADAKTVLNKSLRQRAGTWRDGLNKRGRINDGQSAWIYAEQDQLLASLALSEPRLKSILKKTYRYWLTAFVDRRYGGIHNALTKNGLPPPARALPKHWAWKSGFHEFEHALVAMITASAFEDTPLKLYYAFGDGPAPKDVRPYYFSGALQSADRRDDGVTVATFGAVSFP